MPLKYPTLNPPEIMPVQPMPPLPPTLSPEIFALYRRECSLFFL
jgi:hypothetical protein